MYLRHILGENGEDVASNYLIENGYKIIERNFNCKQGEIDIVAEEKVKYANRYEEEYVFVEVKTRKNKKYGRPSEAVNLPKQKHIYKATEYYVYINKLENCNIRFDVIEVYEKDKHFYINHLKNCEISNKIKK